MRYQAIRNKKENFYYFRFLTDDGRQILESQHYKSKEDCFGGIRAVIKNSGEEARYSRSESDGKFSFILKAGNGQEIGKSVSFDSVVARENAIALFLKEGSKSTSGAARKPAPPSTQTTKKADPPKAEVPTPAVTPPKPTPKPKGPGEDNYLYREAFDPKTTDVVKGFGSYQNKVDKEYYFHFKNDAGDIILISEGYTKESSRENGIQSVIKNSVLERRYERKSDTYGNHYFILKAANGQEIGRGKLYQNEADMETTITQLIGSAKNYAAQYNVDLSATKKTREEEAPKKKKVKKEKGEKIQIKVDTFAGNNAKYYIIQNSKSNKYYFQVKDPNEKFLFSNPNPRGYETLEECEAALQKSLKSSLSKGNYGTKQTKNEKWYFYINDDQGKSLSKSFFYDTKEDMNAAISSLLGSAAGGASAYKGEDYKPLDFYQSQYAAAKNNFDSFAGNDGEHYFTYNGEDGNILLISEGYKDASGRDNGTASVAKNASVEARYETKQHPNGKYYFNLKAGNHQQIATSRWFDSEAERDNAMAWLQGQNSRIGKGHEVVSGALFSYAMIKKQKEAEEFRLAEEAKAAAAAKAAAEAEAKRKAEQARIEAELEAKRKAEAKAAEEARLKAEAEAERKRKLEADNYLPASAYGDGTGFVKFKHEKNQHYFFNYNDDEGKLLLRSEGYTTEPARDNGIQSVIKNAGEEKRWEIKQSATGKYFYILKAGNHQEIARSPYFDDEANMNASLNWARGDRSSIGMGSMLVGGTIMSAWNIKQTEKAEADAKAKADAAAAEAARLKAEADAKAKADAAAAEAARLKAEADAKAKADAAAAEAARLKAEADAKAKADAAAAEAARLKAEADAKAKAAAAAEAARLKAEADAKAKAAAAEAARLKAEADAKAKAAAAAEAARLKAEADAKAKADAAEAEAKAKAELEARLAAEEAERKKADELVKAKAAALKSDSTTGKIIAAAAAGTIISKLADGDDKNAEDKKAIVPEEKDDDYLPCADYEGRPVNDKANNVALFKHDNGQFYFAIYNPNGSVRMRSEGFQNAKTRDIELSGVLKNLNKKEMYSRIEKGNYYIEVLKDKTGREVGRSCLEKMKSDTTPAVTPPVKAEDKDSTAEKVLATVAAGTIISKIAGGDADKDKGKVEPKKQDIKNDYLHCNQYKNYKAGFVEFRDKKSNLLYFSYNDKDGKILLRSEGYNKDNARQKAIEWVKKQMKDSNNFVKKEAADGKHYYALMAGKEEIARSCPYQSAAAMNAALGLFAIPLAGKVVSSKIEAAKKAAAGSPVKKTVVASGKAGAGAAKKVAATAAAGGAGAKAAASSTAKVVGSSGGGFGWLKWLIPILLLLGLAWFLMKGCDGCGKKGAVTGADKTEISAAEKAAAKAKAEADAAAAAAAAAAAKEPVGPSCAELNLTAGSTACNMADYLSNANSSFPKKFSIAGNSFGRNSKELKRNAKTQLADIIKLLKEYPNADIDIYAYHGGGEKGAYGGGKGVTLSDVRARAVYERLRRAGISKSRMNFEGQGGSTDSRIEIIVNNR